MRKRTFSYIFVPPSATAWHTILCALMFLVTTGAFCSEVYAANPSYAFSVKKQSKDELLRLYDQTSGRTIWTQRVADHWNISWSRDRRAICVGVTSLANEPSVLVWQVNHPVKIFAYEDDYLLRGTIWAPDAKHVLFRTGSSGDSDVDFGNLHSINMHTYKVSTLKPKVFVRRALWADSQKVLYWNGHIVGGTKIAIDKRAHSWTVP